MADARDYCEEMCDIFEPDEMLEELTEQFGIDEDEALQIIEECY